MVRIDRRDCTPKKPEPVAQFPEILQQLRRDLDDTGGLQNAVKTQSMVSLKYMSGVRSGSYIPVVWKSQQSDPPGELPRIRF